MAKMDSDSPIIARVGHTGIRFIWETKDKLALNCDMCEGDTWESIQCNKLNFKEINNYVNYGSTER